MEVNPLAGLRPVHSDLCIICSMVGLTYDQLIERIVASAAARIRQAPAERAALCA
jgi:D-alanine-D-alanine ligase